MPDPAPQEYDDETLKQLGRLSLKLANNPKTQKVWQRAVKEIDPSIQFPQLEVETLREEMAAQREKDQLEAQQRATADRLESQRAGLADRFTPEQIGEIEKNVMQKYGLSDYDAAAKLYAADLKPVTPPNTGPRHGQRFDMPSDKALVDDPNKWANDHAYAVLDEMRAQGKR